MAWDLAISVCVVGSLIALPLHGCNENVDVTSADVNTRFGPPLFNNGKPAPPPFGVRRRRPWGWGPWIPKPITRAPTPYPTLAPTSPTLAPTSPPTNQPTPLDMELAMLTKTLHNFMGSNNMLAQINNAVRDNLPDEIDFTDVVAEQDGSEKISLWVTSCKVG